MTDIATLHIDSIAGGGRGVGRLEGMAVFVPRTAPDETVEIALRRHRRFGEGRLRRILEPSPRRVDPRCHHYTADRCGGCQLQHLEYDAQLLAKRQIIGDALGRIARRTVTVATVVPSESPWHYRNKLTLTLRPRGSEWIAGLRPYDAPDEIFRLTECPITAPEVLDGWKAVMAHAHLLPRAAELRGAVRARAGNRSFVLHGGLRWDEGEAFAAACPGFSTIHWVDERGRSRILREPMTGAALPAFDQVNTPVAAALQDYVLARVRQGNPSRVIDAYAGRGATAVALAEEGRDVVAIELDPAAVRLARQALGGRGAVIEGRVEEQLASQLPAAAIVFNPPRTGLDARVCAATEAASPRPARIGSVSCDPGTLARDVGRLPSFRVAHVQPFDMFPQTAHVETVCELIPEAGA